MICEEWVAFYAISPYIADSDVIRHDSAGLCNIWKDSPIFIRVWRDMSGLAIFGATFRRLEVLPRFD